MDKHHREGTGTGPSEEHADRTRVGDVWRAFRKVLVIGHRIDSRPKALTGHFTPTSMFLHRRNMKLQVLPGVMYLRTKIRSYLWWSPEGSGEGNKYATCHKDDWTTSEERNQDHFLVFSHYFPNREYLSSPSAPHPKPCIIGFHPIPGISTLLKEYHRGIDTSELSRLISQQPRSCGARSNSDKILLYKSSYRRSWVCKWIPCFDVLTQQGWKYKARW